MTEERDIVKFAFPFTIGILSAGFFITGINPYHGGLLLLSCAIPTLFLIYTGTRFENTQAVNIAIITAAFITGIICMMTASAVNLAYSEGISKSLAIASGFCDRLRFGICSLPFESEETSSILSALITGDKGTLSGRTTEIFRKSGASHILALSGLHMGIIYGIIRKLLAPLGNSTRIKRIRSIIIISSCGFYTLATGAGDSIVRAFIFIFIHETALIAYRTAPLKQVLPASLIIQLVIDPAAIMSPGFQLSYCAMAGIAYIYPILKGFWPQEDPIKRPGPMKRIWNTAAMSISCQLTTAPLAWHYFNSFPQYFLLSNLIALPLTGIMIPSALICILLDSIGVCPHAMIWFTESCTDLMRNSLEILAEL